jgi:hypothetical protein
MKVSVLYGLMLGVLIVVLDALHSRIAWACYWAVQAVFLAIYTRLTWQRTRLFWMAEGGAHAAIVSAVFVPVSLAGYTVGTLPSPWMAVLWVNVAVLAASHLIARFVHREQWRDWKRHMDSLSLWDMLRFRHIPYLR